VYFFSTYHLVILNTSESWWYMLTFYQLKLIHTHTLCLHVLSSDLKNSASFKLKSPIFKCFIRSVSQFKFIFNLYLQFIQFLCHTYCWNIWKTYVFPLSASYNDVIIDVFCSLYWIPGPHQESCVNHYYWWLFAKMFKEGIQLSL